MRMRDPDFAELERRYGIHLPGVLAFSTPAMAADIRLAMDAQAPLVTTPNAGIPVWLSTMVDPQVIRIAMAPLKATEILGSEVKKGDWTTTTIQFPVMEHVGETSSYGDWNNNGSTGANFNFVNRQAYYYQTVTQWGERELEVAGLAKINYKNELDMASVSVLNRFQNKSYFYGISGLLNYGLLNAPGIPAAIAPSTKAAGGTAWANATANEIFDDVKKLFAQLVTQTKGLVAMGDSFTVALDPTRSVYLSNTNAFGLSAMDMLKKNFPGMRVVTAPEYATDAGNLMQMIVSQIDGQETGYTAFTEKLRAHAIVQDLSAWKQKKSQGTWGAIVKQPLGFAQMIGI
ncbi:MAG: DUF2184 domain-containing protein [Roseomonas sp.]|nr:DUF2184 domain-containing protein [Roseomonas sp.]